MTAVRPAPISPKPISKAERSTRAKQAFDHLAAPQDALVLFDDQFIF